MAKPTTREKLKAAARGLIATHGLDVGVRDIVRAAGCRNISALGYHFGSKDGLVAELLNDIFTHASHSWEARLAGIGGLEKATTRQLIEILVDQETWRSASDATPNVNRFLSSVMQRRGGRSTQFNGLLPTVEFNRVIAQIGANEPAIDPKTMRQRLIYLSWYLLAAMGGLEDAEDPAGRHSGQSIWRTPDARRNLVDTALGLLKAPVDAEL